jgi:hypothetical protein
MIISGQTVMAEVRYDDEDGYQDEKGALRPNETINTLV